MARATGNDLCEIFGFAPDDFTPPSIQQRATQHCPYLQGKVCIKHSHPQRGGAVVVYGSCSVVNAPSGGTPEEVIICPNRLYANNYETLIACIRDAKADPSYPVFTIEEVTQRKAAAALPAEYGILIGQNSGSEVVLEKRGIIKLVFDWVTACIANGGVERIIPCEVQSIDTTGNYHDNWDAYITQQPTVPNSEHGMNWANVWKRLIPQLILKGMIAFNSALCRSGSYFVVPHRVYEQFRRLIGPVSNETAAGPGILTVMTYELGPVVPQGQMRKLVKVHDTRMRITEFAKAFGSGSQVVSLGPALDTKVNQLVASLLA